MSERVKKQHYVWEHYLKEWATNNQIWCKRAGKTFKTSTENVAQERYFYELEPLLQSEIALLRNMINKGSSLSRFVNLSSLKTYVLIANSQGDASKFGIEWHHSMIEGKAAPVLTELRSGNEKVLEDKQSKIALCMYLGHQYTRTKKARNSFAASREDFIIPEKYDDCNLNRIHGAMSFILANSIGSSLCDHLDLKLIKNQSSKKLITSDQPIYNLLAISGDISKESLIYFPVSPKLAIFAKKIPNNASIEDEDKVKNLNAFMVNNSLESVFATSEEELISIEV